MHRKTHRQSTGNMFVIITLIVCFIIMPMLMVAGQFGLYSVDRNRIQNIVEAAGLLAANDLSRIVVNDPYFGYVSLSNYAPIGNGTSAEDGEPLPVAGINTLIGTLRQNSLVAAALGNGTMSTLIQTDHYYLDETIRTLNKTMKNAVSERAQALYDIHGQRVETTSDVRSFLSRNLPPNIKVESVHLSVGWLKDGGSTTIDAPADDRLGQIKPADRQLGKYRPFVEVPVNGQSFMFAGVGKASALAPVSKFCEADDRHISSIVKIDCVLLLNNRQFMPFGSDALSKIECVACSEPFSQDESGAGPVMTVHYEGLALPPLQCFRDCLNEGNFHDSMVAEYDASSGDYPLDANSRMALLQLEDKPTTAQQFAKHLYYWLRSGHTRAKLEAVLAMINQSYTFAPGSIYAYEFAKNGSINRRVLRQNPFPIGVTADGQFETIADTTVAGAYTPVIIFRDNVANPGTVYGGKHGGQPFPGTPLNWCDLRDYSGDTESGDALSSGKSGTGLALTSSTDSSANAADRSSNEFGRLNSLFRSIGGNALAYQPRRSYYGGGLGLDIEVGCAGPSTAMLDVQRMRQLRR